MFVLIIGGDGFCGWPTTMHLSKAGYQVAIVDNLSRRRIDEELGEFPLTPIRSLDQRLSTWKEMTGATIPQFEFNVAIEYDKLLSTIQLLNPDVIIHYAELKSAPYSMRSSYHKRLTVSHNINATNNILCAIVESGLDIHLIHLGTTGVYGYGNEGAAIPEGYLNVKIGDVETEILHPAYPGSIYHVTKVNDEMLFYYYNKNDKIRITDLHQGIVWGTSTKETESHEDFINRFDYGGDYGTVLNRFLMQAAVGHPLTVYGTGGQTRAFIHLRDSVNCVRLAIENPPAEGERVKIFNQTTESHRVIDLAEKIRDIFGAEIRYYEDPRLEAKENELDIKRENFMDVGLEPITLNDGLLKEIVSIASKYKDRCDKSKIISTSVWRKGMKIDLEGSTEKK